MLVSDPAQGGGHAALPTHGNRVLTGPGCALTLNVPNRTWRLVSAVIMLAGITLLLVLSQLIDCRTRGREREEATRYHSDRSFRVPGSLQGLGVPRRLAAEAVAVAGGLVPTREELVRSWVYTGAAKGEGVLRAEQDVARTLQAGGHPVDQATNSSAAALTSVMYLKKRARGIDDILTEPLGVVLSSARHTAWLGDCLPFIKALNASERQSATVAPVEFRPKNAVPLSRQIASVVSAALAAVALGRPFRAAVGSAFAKGYVRPNLFNWKVHRDHYDLVKEKRPHITFESVRDMLHTGGGMTGGLASDQAAEFDLQTLLLERAELPPEELLPVLARRLSRFGGMGQVDMEQAIMCTTLALFRPTPATILRIEELLETVADEQGAGMLIGIAPSSINGADVVQADRLLSHLECAWRLSAAFEADGGRGGAAWVIVNETQQDVVWSAAMQSYANEFLAAALQNASVASTARVQIIPLDSVIVPVDLDPQTFQDWLAYFLLLETHTCTRTQSVLGMIGCAASIRHYHVAQDRMMKIAECV